MVLWASVVTTTFLKMDGGDIILKKMVEVYGECIFYMILALSFISTLYMIFDMHRDMFQFDTVELRAEHLFQKEDIPVIYATHRYVSQDQPFDPLDGVYAIDRYDGRIEDLDVEGEVDIHRSDMYILTYHVVNSLGFHNEKKVFVYVEEA